MEKNNKSSSPKEEFIVQNVTPGYHSVSDIHIDFGPLEIVDLTFKDPDEVKGSKDLKNSLKMGYLRVITKEAAEKAADKKTAQLRRSVTQLQNKSRTESLQIQGKSVEVEPLNLSRTDSAKMSEQVTTAGYANDPLSYTIALEIAQTQAENMGEELSVEEFADRVARDSELVRRIITSNTNAIPAFAGQGLDSGAYFNEPTDSGSSTVSKKRMKAPPTMFGGSDDDDSGPLGRAEGIDLTEELNK